MFGKTGTANAIAMSPIDEIDSQPTAPLLGEQYGLFAADRTCNPLREVCVAGDIEVQNKQVGALSRAWNSTSKGARERFLGAIDTPVFDRVRA